VRHPNVVQPYFLGRHEGCPYLVLEYFDGPTLRQLIREEQLSIQQVLRLALNIAEALKAIHSSAVLHLDLKPSNIVIAAGEARVVDFGIAQAVVGEESSERDFNEYQSRKAGTYEYMAPEQWTGERLSAKTDIWAFGVILHELLTGSRPYLASRLKGGEMVIGPIPIPVAMDSRDLPIELINLVRRTLSKAALDRPTAAEVVERLNSLALTEEIQKQRAPFVGLSTFRERDASIFFGRDDDIEAVLALLQEAEVVAVAGASGAGKSSLIHAGVVPILRRRGWEVLEVTPGREPFARLADVLSQATTRFGELVTEHTPEPLEEVVAPTGWQGSTLGALKADSVELTRQLSSIARACSSPLLLIIDQLEELFTHALSSADRLLFLKLISAVRSTETELLRVVVTLRTDFEDNAAASPEFHQVLNSSRWLVGRLSRSALVKTLTGPLENTGVRFEDEALVDRIVTSVEGEVAALPLIQFTAAMLWRHRSDSQLSWATYEKIGRVEGALGRYADRCLRGFIGEQEVAVQQLVLRLVTVDGARKKLSWADTVESLPNGAEATLQRLLSDRILQVVRSSANEPVEVQLVHESLVEHSSLINRWLTAHRDDHHLLEDLEAAARTWSQDRKDVRVWDSKRYNYFKARWEMRDSSLLPSQIAEEYLSACEAKKRQNSRRQRWWVAGALGVLLFVAIAFAFIAVRAQSEGRRVQLTNAEYAIARRRMPEARSLIRALADEKLDSHVRSLIARADGEALVWTHQFGGWIYSADFSPTGEYVAFGAQNNVVYVTEVETGKVLMLHGHHDQVISVDFSPDGSLLASGDQSGTVLVWKLESKKLAKSQLGNRWPKETPTRISELSFSGDGKRLTAVAKNGEMLIWNLQEDQLLQTVAPKGIGKPRSVSFSNGGVVVLGDRGLASWLPGARFPVLIEGPQFKGASRLVSRDGHTAFVTKEGVYRNTRGRLDAWEFIRWEGSWKAPNFVKDHLYVSVLQSPGIATKKYDAKNIEYATVNWPGKGRVLSISADGKMAVSAAGHGRVFLWRIESHPLPPPTDALPEILHVCVGENGQLYSSTAGPHIRLWSSSTGRSRKLSAFPSSHGATMCNPRDSTFAAGRPRGFILGLPRGPEIKKALGSNAIGFAFAPRASEIAVVTQKAIHFFHYSETSLQAKERRHPLESKKALVIPVDEEVRRLVYTPDGEKLLFLGRDSGILSVVDIDAGEVSAAPAEVAGRVVDMAVSSDGDWWAVGLDDGEVRLYNTKSRSAQVAGRHSGRVETLAFNPNSTLLASGSVDGIQVWRVGRLGPAEARIDIVVNDLEWIDRTHLLVGTGDGETVALDALSQERLWDRQPDMLPEQRIGPSARSALSEGSPLSDQAGLTLCIVQGPIVSGWRVEEDKSMGEAELPCSPVDVVANSKSCIFVCHGHAYRYSFGGRLQSLGTNFSVVGRAAGQVWAISGSAAIRFGVGGREVERHQLPTHAVGATSITATRSWIVLGFREGIVRLIPRNLDNEKLTPELSALAPSPVETLAAIPDTEIVVAGQRSGIYTFWSLHSGQSFRRGRLDGPVTQIDVTESTVVVGSRTGDRTLVRLEALTQEDDLLLQSIHERYPRRENGQLKRPLDRGVRTR
jgi:WD40 repeat protein